MSLFRSFFLLFGGNFDRGLTFPPNPHLSLYLSLSLSFILPFFTLGGASLLKTPFQKKHFSASSLGKSKTFLFLVVVCLNFFSFIPASSFLLPASFLLLLSLSPPFHTPRYPFFKAVGLMTSTTTRLLTIKTPVMRLTRKILPRLAGKEPRMIQYY